MPRPREEQVAGWGDGAWQTTTDQFGHRIREWLPLQLERERSEQTIAVPSSGSCTLDYYHRRVDAGMRVRCVDCRSQLQVGIDARCEACAFKHGRRADAAARVS